MIRWCFVLTLLAACEVARGPGDPCAVDADCGDGMICPTEDDPLLGFVGVCVAPCGAGCCAEDAQCMIEDGAGVCVEPLTGTPARPSDLPSCWPDAGCTLPGALFGSCLSECPLGESACCASGLECFASKTGGVCVPPASTGEDWSTSVCAAALGDLVCDLGLGFCYPSCADGCDGGSTCDEWTQICVYPW